MICDCSQLIHEIKWKILSRSHVRFTLLRELGFLRSLNLFNVRYFQGSNMSKSNDYLKALGANYDLIGSECQIKDEIKKIM